MYKMKAGGVVFYDPSSDDTSLHVINPEATFEVNKVDKLTFEMLPDNVMYNGFEKMVTIVTLEQDGEVIFRGRVLETTTNSYNKREVYCEGELGYLHDSCIRPYYFDGKAIDLFHQIVDWHNEQVEEHKRFEVGIVTAIDEDTEAKTDSQNYADALGELRQMFVTVYRGYLRIRTVDGVRYLDYIKEFTDECEQPIAFGVNLVDIENKIDAGEVFSVLIPLGGYNTVSRNTPVDIKDVNDGKDYLEDADAIAKYGRIVKTYKWEDCKDPQELKERGLQQFEKLKENRTITIKAVDLHIIDTSYEAIRIGKNVQLLSDPHGLNEPDACTKIKLVIEKPENTEYTFGYPPEPLTDSNVAKNRRTDYNYNELHKWLSETNTELNVTVGIVTGNGNRITILEGDFDALEGAITLKADQTAVSALYERMSSAEVRIDGAEAEIDLKASKEFVSVLGDRVSAAELRIDGAESAITAKADLILLDGYVKTTDLETGVLSVLEDANIDSIHAQSLAVDGNSSLHGSVDVGGDVYAEGTVDATSMNTTTLTVGDSTAAWKGGTFVTGIGSVTMKKDFANVMLADGTTKGITYMTGVEITPATAYINYMGKA